MQHIRLTGGAIDAEHTALATIRPDEEYDVRKALRSISRGHCSPPSYLRQLDVYAEKTTLRCEFQICPALSSNRLRGIGTEESYRLRGFLAETFPLELWGLQFQLRKYYGRPEMNEKKGADAFSWPYRPNGIWLATAPREFSDYSQRARCNFRMGASPDPTLIANTFALIFEDAFPANTPTDFRIWRDGKRLFLNPRTKSYY